MSRKQSPETALQTATSVSCLWELCSGPDGYVDPYRGTKQAYAATYSQIPCLFNWKLRSSFLKRVHASGGQVSSQPVMNSEWIMNSLYIYSRNQDNGIRPLRHFRVFPLVSISFGPSPKNSFTSCTIRIAIFKHIQTVVPLILHILSYL